ncbi:shikimate dehydrogenase [Bacillus pakistanensis]|uniref:Shikimate dehydrogenase (NADP(+)) n=1 Tax=Rossellomorea pakistanensis TaxID=992288 RepID=A0ABS2NA79_9BACI|nr:shikimate dehydrogenase [Bacillus pakistanensis]MBM7584757.1 shikimate dehydrogenase [Bacillus pakistanensis]
MKKLYGVIGDPIEHSMSPIMHNDAFKQLNLDAYYHPFHVNREDIGSAVKGMKALGIRGFNVTIPHKSSIIPFLDGIDPLAQAIGAVNTVVLEEGEYIGYNTDGLGFLKGLEEECPFSIEKKKVMMIGAGGAARAIFYTLASSGIEKIDIVNRTVQKGEQIINECPYPTNSKVLNLSEGSLKMNDYDIIIQTTSIGMYPYINESPISLEFLSKQVFISDIIYNPFNTRLLIEASSKSCSGQNGLAMFVNQGALAFKKWTGVLPDTDRMKNIVKSQLGG